MQRTRRRPPAAPAPTASRTGLAGQTVQLLNGTTATVIATTTTGSTGAYSFANVTPGSYTVEVVKAAGETFSPAGTLPNSMVSASGAATVTVASGGTATVNAGEYQAGTVTGTVFTDLTGTAPRLASRASLARPCSC
ncbi:SdrD B-like domain-containing protein [Acidisoma sp.]|uniref:SdrD B-like domain-containing protein n=1 Tax=Acidisoma sp. TaxID=1872115 RepID=UPI003B00DD59